MSDEDPPLHVQTLGLEPAPDVDTVLMVHGYGASAFSWRYWAPRLPRDTRRSQGIRVGAQTRRRDVPAGRPGRVAASFDSSARPPAAHDCGAFARWRNRATARATTSRRGRGQTRSTRDRGGRGIRAATATVRRSGALSLDRDRALSTLGRTVGDPKGPTLHRIRSGRGHGRSGGRIRGTAGRRRSVASPHRLGAQPGARTDRRAQRSLP